MTTTYDVYCYYFCFVQKGSLRVIEHQKATGISQGVIVIPPWLLQIAVPSTILIPNLLLLECHFLIDCYTNM